MLNSCKCIKIFITFVNFQKSQEHCHKKYCKNDYLWQSKTQSANCSLLIKLQIYLQFPLYLLHRTNIYDKHFTIKLYGEWFSIIYFFRPSLAISQHLRCKIKKGMLWFEEMKQAVYDIFVFLIINVSTDFILKVMNLFFMKQKVLKY